MKAEEMFNKLGWSKENEDEDFIEYYTDSYSRDTSIIFDKTSKSIQLISDTEINCTFSFVILDKLRKAISKQIKEMGW